MPFVYGSRAWPPSAPSFPDAEAKNVSHRLPAPAGRKRAIVPPNAKTVTIGSPTRRSFAPVHSSRAVHSRDTPQNHAPPISETAVSNTRPLTPWLQSLLHTAGA